MSAAPSQQVGTWKTKREVKAIFKEATGCVVQHTGWTCGTCFFSVLPEADNADWQALLHFRGDYGVKDLDNLTEDWKNRVQSMANSLREQAANRRIPA